ncbi:aldehyde dehydrogenase (NAD(+)) [Ranunculus cassubicifolius]
MAARRISSLLSRSLISSPPSSVSALGKNSRSISNFSSKAGVTQEPVTPNVKVEHTQLFINGKFVDAASGFFSVNLIIVVVVK